MLNKINFKTLKYLWDKLGDIPVNDNDEIETLFCVPGLLFLKGASKFDIWHWFDEQCPNNLYDDLMFPKAGA